VTFFFYHLVVFKNKICHPKGISTYGFLVVGLLDLALLLSFVITMKNDSHGALHLPLDYNPRTNLWGHLTSNAIVG
jgi:hypothetical protein